MIISTRKEELMTVPFIFFNFFVYWILKFTLFDPFMKAGGSIPIVSSLLVLSAIITGLIYILFNIRFINNVEKQVMKNSQYLEQFDCSIYPVYPASHIIFIEKGKINVYINHMFLMMNFYKSDIPEYVSDLKTSVKNLNKKDIFVILLYKKLEHIFLSILFFVVWNLTSMINNKNVFVEISEIIFSTIAAIIVYLIVSKLFKKYITNIIKKRNLQFILTK